MAGDHLTGDGRKVPVDVLAALDQQDAVIHDLVLGIVRHWEGCPAEPPRICLGGIVQTTHTLAHDNPCKAAAMLQAALAGLAKVEWERTHATG